MSNSKLFVYGVDQGCENHEIQALLFGSHSDLDPHPHSNLRIKASRVNLKWFEISKFNRSNDNRSKDKEGTFG